VIPKKSRPQYEKMAMLTRTLPMIGTYGYEYTIRRPTT
jgi:hypothetical protein